jgi:hypothetical protein
MGPEQHKGERLDAFLGAAQERSKDRYSIDAKDGRMHVRQLRRQGYRNRFLRHYSWLEGRVGMWRRDLQKLFTQEAWSWNASVLLREVEGQCPQARLAPECSTTIHESREST